MLEEGVRSEAGAAIHRMACIVARSGPEVLAAFLQYLDDESPIVQVATADLALRRGLARERAYATLERVQDQSGDIALTASILLRMWQREHDPIGHMERTRAARQ